MGKERSLRKVLEDNKCSTKLAQLGRWSSRWRWVERAQAYDDEIYRELRAKNEKQIVEAAERQAGVGRLFQSKSVQRIGNLDPSTLTVAQATILAKVGAELEARALGMPSQVIRAEVTHKEEGPDYSKKTPQELRAEGIAALIASGFRPENAALLVDQMMGFLQPKPEIPVPGEVVSRKLLTSGDKEDGQRTRDSANGDPADPPMAEGPPEG